MFKIVRKKELNAAVTLLEIEAPFVAIPWCVWNATPRSLSPLERNNGFWTQAYYLQTDIKVH